MLKHSPDSILMGELNPFNFPEIAKRYGVNSIELVTTFYLGKVDSLEYWKAFKEQCDKSGVSVNLIVRDLLLELASKDSLERIKAAKAHFDWVEIASNLGAKSLRVNLNGMGDSALKANNSVHGLKVLADYAAKKNVNILVENHGGLSSNAAWLANVIKEVNMDNVGTLPDFGNFCIKYGAEGCEIEYDRYKGLKELMLYAKVVSAKSNDFDLEGNEPNIDYERIMKIIKVSGYSGYIGVEYEGEGLSEEEGINKTIQLLRRTL